MHSQSVCIGIIKAFLGPFPLVWFFKPYKAVKKKKKHAWRISSFPTQKFPAVFETMTTHFSFHLSLKLDTWHNPVKEDRDQSFKQSPLVRQALTKYLRPFRSSFVVMKSSATSPLPSCMPSCLSVLTKCNGCFPE